MSHGLLTGIFAALLVPGMFMVLVPMMPAISYMFVIAALYGFVDRFTHLSLANLGILAIILAVSIAIDYSAGLLGAKYGGASRNAIIAGVVGLAAGTLLFPPFGGLLGLFIGVLLYELRRKGQAAALRAAAGSLAGAFAGIVANSILAVIFFITFLLSAV